MEKKDENHTWQVNLGLVLHAFFVNYIYFVSFCISILPAYKFTTKNKSLVLFDQIKFISFKPSYNFKIHMSCGLDSHDIVLTSTYVLFWIKFLINIKKCINANIVLSFSNSEKYVLTQFLDRRYGFKLPQTTPLKYFIRTDDRLIRNVWWQK